jgi:para-aminobenzoate synthetase component 1
MYRKVIKRIDAFELFQKLYLEKDVCFFYSNSEKGWQKNIAMEANDKFIYNGGNLQKFENDLERFVYKNTKKNRKICGFIAYDIGYEIYNLKKTAKDDLCLPKAVFMAFDNWVEVMDGGIRLIYKDKKFVDKIFDANERKIPKQKNIQNCNFVPEMRKKKYNDSYKKIKQHIYDGDIYQINLTHRLKARTDLTAKELFVRVARANPVDFLAYLEGDGFEIISASPERFVRIEKQNIETCPVKGTRPRGKNKMDDERLKKELMRSEKEAAELNMITDLMRNDLGKVCEIGSVKVMGSRLISVCSTVFHTYSKVVGKISKKTSQIKALISVLPGGSITGCPKKRAMQVIDELEPVTRGIYTGVVGQINSVDQYDFSIAIRTIVKKGKNLFLQVGGGIVLDSNLKDEFEETLVKAKSFMNIL